MPTPKVKEIPPPPSQVHIEKKPIQVAPVEIQNNSVPKAEQSETFEPTKILARRKYEEKDLLEEESKLDNEVASTSFDVFWIYYLMADEIFVNLSTFLYDLVSKQIIKETTHKILKEDELDRI